MLKMLFIKCKCLPVFEIHLSQYVKKPPYMLDGKSFDLNSYSKEL